MSYVIALWVRSRRVVAAAFTVLMVMVTVVACGQTDPRAYPGSQSRSLENMLEWFGLQLPSCDYSGLRYYSSGDFIGDLSLTFDSSEKCVNMYLRQLHVDPMEDAHVRPGSQPGMNRGTIDKLDWPITSTKKLYRTYEGEVKKKSWFDIVVDCIHQSCSFYLDGGAYGPAPPRA